MPSTNEQLEEWMQANEGEALEFKAAASRYDFEKLTKYCVALANEGGGKVILGVSDARPRQVLGSAAFAQPEATESSLRQRLHLAITVEEILHPDGRAVVIHIPPHPVGVAIQYDGRFWARDGESLIPMPSDKLRQIFDEAGHDFSADICDGLTLEELDPAAVERFRTLWIRKSQNSSLQAHSHQQILIDIEAMNADGLTNAALILFGTHAAVGKYMAQAEVTFEYRSSDASGPAQDRKEYRQGFFGYFDELWNTINLRNDVQTYQDGAFVLNISTFDERSVREAILNAVSHRNYQLGGNVFVRQYPRRIEVTSPGGLPVEVSLETILDRQSPRNRRIADILTKCTLVERSGQGINLMYEAAIRQTKQLPDFQGTDAVQVSVKLFGEVRNKAFLRYLDKFEGTVLDSLSTNDWLVIDHASREVRIPDSLRSHADSLLERGLIVRAGRGGFILAKSYYSFQNKEDHFDALREHEVRKETLEAEIGRHTLDGVARGQLAKLLPKVSYDNVGKLLAELQLEGRVHSVGVSKAGRWYPGPGEGE